MHFYLTFNALLFRCLSKTRMNFACIAYSSGNVYFFKLFYQKKKNPTTNESSEVNHSQFSIQQIKIAHSTLI